MNVRVKRLMKTIMSKYYNLTTVIDKINCKYISVSIV